jgi:hypothetical protein
VWCRGVDPLLSPEIFPKQLSRLPRCVFSGVEVMLHDWTTSHKERKVHSGKCSDAGNPACDQAVRNAQEGAGMIACITIKNREENKFSSRVEVRGCGPEEIRGR